MHLINPTASQVMNPTDLHQCLQHPGDLVKLLDHHREYYQRLECHHQAQGLKLQLIKLGECLQKWFTSTWETKKPPGRESCMSSKKLIVLLTSKQQRRKLEQVAGSLRTQLTMQAEQHLNHYVQEEQAYFTSHLRNVESHLQAEVANTKLHLQQEYWVRTTEIEARAAASDNAYAQLH